MILRKILTQTFIERHIRINSDVQIVYTIRPKHQIQLDCINHRCLCQ